MAALWSVIQTMEDIIERILNAQPKNLGPTLCVEELSYFERQHKISLPTDFRKFLLKVGNGGDGPPEYGLLKLGEYNKNDVPEYLNNGYGNKLSVPFKYQEHWVWDGEEDEPEFENKVRETEYGCLALGHDGCGMFWLLVVNGPQKGKVWQTTESGIVPCAPSLTFTEWYENWLNGNTDWWSEYEEP